VRVQQVPAPVGQGHRPLATVEGDGADQSLVAQVVEVLIEGIAEIPFCHDAKCSGRGECSTVLAVQFVAMIPVQNNFAFEAARQVETLEEDITRITATLPRISVGLARIVITLARVVIRRVIGRSAPELDPLHLDLAGILVAIPRIIPSRIVAAGRRVPFREPVRSTRTVGYSGSVRGRIRRDETPDVPSGVRGASVRRTFCPCRALSASVHVRRGGEVDGDFEDYLIAHLSARRKRDVCSIERR
jgi:hypothetical protein